MPGFVKNITLEDVHRIKRPGLGYVYIGKIEIGVLADALQKGDIRYAPKYQRGPKPSDENDFDANTLLDISNERLQIERPRAEAMAAKYLMALAGEGHRQFYNPGIIWNARREDHVQAPEYDERKRLLTLHSTITIPDSAHRHYKCYILKEWKENPDSVPDEVVVAEDGESVDGDNIRRWLDLFDPYDPEESSVLVEVFNVTREQEGKLFDEYNVEGKRPSTSASIDMYADKTASRRFVQALMDTCAIFDRSEIETRANTIATQSRKITTIATLDVSAKQFNRQLLVLEKQKAAYRDLVDFVCNFYTEWANHYPEFAPTASGKARKDLRDTSFAMSNVMFFPMFRLAWSLWDKYRNAKVDWRAETEWRTALARIGGSVDVEVDEGGTKVKKSVRIMDRDVTDPPHLGNPAWRDRIVLQQFDSKGNPRNWMVSNTRQTREAAYHYLVEVAGVSFS